MAPEFRSGFRRLQLLSIRRRATADTVSNFSQRKQDAHFSDRLLIATPPYARQERGRLSFAGEREHLSPISQYDDKYAFHQSYSPPARSGDRLLRRRISGVSLKYRQRRFTHNCRSLI